MRWKPRLISGYLQLGLSFFCTKSRGCCWLGYTAGKGTNTQAQMGSGQLCGQMRSSRGKRGGRATSPVPQSLRSNNLGTAVLLAPWWRGQASSKCIAKRCWQLFSSRGSTILPAQNHQIALNLWPSTSDPPAAIPGGVPNTHCGC